MTKRISISIAFVAAAMLLVGGFSLRPGVTRAQDMGGTPEAMESHPAHIHLGTCDALGEVVFPLTDVTATDSMSTPMAGEMESTPMGEMADDMGDMMSNVVATSESTVDATLDAIISGGHAINVHESAENIQNYIACGEVTGTATDGQLQIDLNELNDSGYEGRAVLTDNGDGTTKVVVMLMHTDDMMSTPVASPTS